MSKKSILLLLICILLFAAIGVVFKLNGARGIQDSLTNCSILEKVYYVTQIAVTIAVVIGGIIGVWQYTLTSKAERIKLEVDRIQKAIDLAEYYKNEILKKYRVVQFVFDKSGILNILKKLDIKSMHNFDKMELDTLMSSDDQKQIKDLRMSIEFVKAVTEAAKIYALDINVNEIIDKSAKEENSNELIAITLGKFMGNMIADLSNDLEFFAMHFTHKTADETVVYQSLHQTYLIIVQALYYNIAINNTMKDSKYFTNIIDLYRLWNQRDIAEKNNKLEAARNYESQGSIVEGINN